MDAPDEMPLPQLPDNPQVALLPVNTDGSSAVWLPLLRAAVRRTRQRLFILFTGTAASQAPCEALVLLAAAALELAATEHRPQLDVVPLFPTAGWDSFAADEAPGKQQAEVLQDVQVVFAGNAAAAVPSDSSRDSAPNGSAAAGLVIEELDRQPTPDAAHSQSVAVSGDGATSQSSRSAGRIASGSAERGGSGGGGVKRFGPSRQQQPQEQQQEQQKQHSSTAAQSAAIGSAAATDMGTAVQLADMLTSSRQGGGAMPVAIGTLEPVASPGGNEAQLRQGSSVPRQWGHVAVGGTFDRLHAGHRILLAASALVATEAVYIGVTGPQLLKHKQHAELLQPYAEREEAARSYVQRVRPGVAVRTGELHDAKGLAAEVEQIQALVVSEETAQGAEAINVDRAACGFSPLEVLTVALVGAVGGAAAKLSSTELRAAEAAARTSKPSTGNDW